MTLDLCFFF